MNPAVDIYISTIKQWQDEMKELRIIILKHQLHEAIKWGKPCYAYEDTNILIIQGFKDYCGLLFFKGALLKDTNNILTKQGENTQAGRVIKFTSVQEIIKSKNILNVYIKEAIEVEKAGLKVEMKKNTELDFCQELQDILKKNTALKKAFNALTPGRQRAYNIYISGAKQATTRISRIENYIPKILSGKGINDCTCGLSKKMPYCDGSHKYKK